MLLATVVSDRNKIVGPMRKKPIIVYEGVNLICNIPN